ncbi:MAG: MCE family protein [Actinomycetes bacterium]
MSPVTGRHAGPTRRRTLVTASVVTAGALATSACQGLYGMALPGSIGGPGTYQVSAVFRDVADLVPQSAVKVGDVTVGSVRTIRVDGWDALVVMQIKDSVQLPANAVADIQQTSLLGEKYVALAPPTTVVAQGRLAHDAVIPLARTGLAPEVEQVLGALALLLNGGGVAQLKTITVELNKALSGREGVVRDLIVRLNVFIGTLDAQKSQVVRALDGLDRLSALLAAQRQTIGTAIDRIGPALGVLADQQAQLTRMLTALAQLGTVGTRVIAASTNATVADLAALRPILTTLNEAGANLPNALDLLVTYPFTQGTVTAMKGDYTNLSLRLRLNLTDLYGMLVGPSPGPSLPVPVPTTPVPTPVPTSVPTSVPTLPGLPLPTPTLTVPPLTSGTSGGSAFCPPLCLSGVSARTTGDPGYDPGLAALLVGGYV